MNAVCSTLDLPEHSVRPAAILLDHMRRTCLGLRGFGVYGGEWLRPWMAYCVSPLTNRLLPGRIASYDRFKVRTGQCDLCAFANVFADYPLPLLRTALQDVDFVLDLGANVGAFSLLMQMLDPGVRIVAVEPEPENVAFLRAQPFAATLEIKHAAVAPRAGTARLRRGINSVTHQVEFVSPDGAGETVPTVTLDSLCQAPALVKMDIEGAELAILQQGLPDYVRHLVLEWHYTPGTPAELIEGNWRHISTDLYGATTWWWSR